MRNLKLGKKLGLSFGIILVLTMCSGIFSYTQISAVSDSFEFVTNDQLAALLDGATTLNEGNDVNYTIRGYRFTETPDMLEQARKSLDVLKASMKGTEELLNKYPRLQIVRNYYPRMSENTTNIISSIEKVFELSAQKEETEKKLVTANEPVFAAARELFNDRVASSIEAIDKIARTGALYKTVEKRDIESAKIRIGQHVTLAEDLMSRIVSLNAAVNFAIADKFSPDIAENMKKEIDSVLTVLGKLQNTALAPATKQMLVRIETGLNEWIKVTNEYVALRDGLIAHYNEVMNLQLEMKATFTDYNNELAAGMDELSGSSMGELLSVQNITLIGIAVSLIIGIILSFITARAISRPVRRIVEIAKRIGRGDFTIKREEFGYEGRDEIGTLVNAFDDMVREQADVINGILGTAEDIANESLSLAALSEETNASMEEISASVDQITSLSSKNSSALEESNAGVEEMAAGAATVANSATNGAQNASSTSEVTENAVKVVEDVISQINNVGSMSDNNEKEIRELVASVEQITGFVGIITSIADQTNLLALNAAIEAARAGEAGRGFSVVADEVRKLAEESAHAAKNISEQIGGLQASAQKAIGGTVKSAEIVHEVLQMAKKAQSSLNDALERMKVINDEIQNIAAIAEEQAASSKEMAGAIDVVTQGTIEVGQRITGVQNASAEASKAAEGVAVTAQSLSNHAANMTEVLAHFKIDKTPNKPALQPR